MFEMEIKPYHPEDDEVFCGPATAPWANIHMGETAIILGSGKSLNDVPKKLLEKYPSFGVNHIYLLPFQPTYWLCIDNVYLTMYAKEMYDSAARAELAFVSNLMVGIPALGLRELCELGNACYFGEDTIRFPGEYCMTGETVVYVALKVAYAMGFGIVLLVGCDRDKGWEYFSKDYPAEWKELRPASDWEIKKRGMEYHFEIASEIYKEAGKRIVNFSLPSKLDEFFERGEIGDWL